MSQFGKEPDPNKGGAGGAQKDCDACGNRGHVQQASKGDNWDKMKTSELSGATQASADRAGDDKHGGILGPCWSANECSKKVPSECGTGGYQIGENSAWITHKEASVWQKLQRLHRLQRLA